MQFRMMLTNSRGSRWLERVVQYPEVVDMDTAVTKAKEIVREYNVMCNHEPGFGEFSPREVLSVELLDDKGDPIPAVKEDCLACDGTGKMRLGKPCPICNGIGKESAAQKIVDMAAPAFVPDIGLIYSRQHEQTDTYTYRINGSVLCPVTLEYVDRKVIIQFIDQKFTKATYPMMGLYDRNGWRILAAIEREITRLENEAV